MSAHRAEHNLLNEQMLRELAGSVGMIAENPAVKLIVLEAAGKVFSAGVDIGECFGERAFSMLACSYSGVTSVKVRRSPFWWSFFFFFAGDWRWRGTGGLRGPGGGHATRAICAAGNYHRNVSSAGFHHVSAHPWGPSGRYELILIDRSHLRRSGPANWA